MVNKSKKSNKKDLLENVFKERENKKIFKDKAAFDLNLIPEQIVVRGEFEKIIDFYDDALNYQLPQNLIITGPTGSGKTLAALFYGKAADEYAQSKTNFRWIYVNCREILTPYTFYQVLLSEMGLRVPRGFGITELLEKFVERARSYKHIILVLDEFDKLYATNIEKANDILYTITRMRESTIISTIMISNNIHFTTMFDAPIESSLNSKFLHLPPYSPEQMLSILKYRSEKGFKKGVFDEKVLSYIAAYTVKHGGDARFGIRLLFNIGELAESKGKDRISADDVKESIEKTKNEMEVGIIERLSRGQLLVLKSLVSYNRGKKKKLIPVKDAYSTFTALCDKLGDDTFSYVHYWRTLNTLSKLDLLYSWLEKRSNGGYARLIELNVDEVAVERVFKARIEV